ncbi:MAG: DUF2804 domain-containing protein [Clostridia bacterium]
MQHRLTAGRLLDENGSLNEAGYATSLIRAYDRAHICSHTLRIKEWDYYLVYNDRFGVALTIDDNAYMGLVSASFLDFEHNVQKTVSPMFWFPRGTTGFPQSSAHGNLAKQLPCAGFSFTQADGKRRLVAHLDRFIGDTPFDCDITLSEEPRDSMVIATPFAEKKTHFYYNQKIIGMRACGSVAVGGSTHTFDPLESFGLLDWGRGVWTYNNTWYWGAGHGIVDGHVVGFNIGYGFGDCSAATENMLFVDGIAHKLAEVTFHIPQKNGKDDFLTPWTFSSSDGRFEMAFTPVLDRAAKTDVVLICSDQHQVFGWMDGVMQLDDGTKIELKHFMAFAEKVRNKW